ncbi:hypothetical protein IMSAGC018_00732 [Lachnospiraceae bacterium]|nr:hypothetical protein IMSAGC018_00732 [Lachnospiraceae bacterium]
MFNAVSVEFHEVIDEKAEQEGYYVSSKSLVICDQEEGYAAAFAVFLMRKKELAFQVQVCNSLSQVQTILCEHSIDVLVVGGNYPVSERKGLRAGNVFVLSESGKTETNSDETLIYKYQSGEILLAEIIRKCSEENRTEDLYFRKAKTKNSRIIGIFSPVHRSGKTGYGLKLGQELAVSKNVLYLNLEIYGGIGGYFPEEGHTLADVLYYSRQEKQNLGVILTTLVEHMGPLDYLLPVRVSEDIRTVTLEEWVSLLGQIEEQSIYDVLILDLDEGLKDVYELLRNCTEIIVPTVKDVLAKAKLLQMEEELHFLGFDDVKKKMVKKELIS